MEPPDLIAMKVMVFCFLAGHVNLVDAETCPWKTPTAQANLLQCGDNYYCDVSIQGWSCCVNHQGRDKCPPGYLMCAAKKCAGNRHHCCEHSCDNFGGLRECDTHTSTTTTKIDTCPWMTPTKQANIMQCGDKYYCDVTIQGWSCCVNHQGREKCPPGYFMCAAKKCAGNRHHCCEHSCDSFGGLRVCDTHTTTTTTAITTTTTTTSEIDPCPSGWSVLATGCYKFVSAKSHGEATSSCEDGGGYLAEINEQEEQDEFEIFYEKSKLKTHVWLGGTDEKIEGQWMGTYSGREILDFNGWMSGKPSGGFSSNCVITHPSWYFKWHDWSCFWKHSAAALCEYPRATKPKPTTETFSIPTCPPAFVITIPPTSTRSIVPICPPVPTCPTYPTCPPTSSSPPVPTCPPVPVCPTGPPTPVVTCPTTSTCPPVPTCPTEPAKPSNTVKPSTLNTTTSIIKPSTPKTATSAQPDHLRCTYNYNLTSTNGTIIESPGNLHYPDNTSCTWTFAAPEGSRVSLTFLELDTEYGYDIIRVMDGIDKNDTHGKAPILAIISGTTIPETVISSKHEMRVSFKSDERITRKGFKAFATILIKEELPKFDWKDKNRLNITFPNGNFELIVMHREKHVDTACIFKGSTNATSVIATLLYSHGNCYSISENANVEISVISSHYIKGKKCIFLLKNGQLKQINEPIFVNNGKKVRKNLTIITVPKLIQIPIQFAFDKSLFTKFQVYGRGRDYIVQTIEKLFYQSKWSFEEFSDITKIELVMEKDVLFINKTLKMTKRDHASCRQFQKSENTPTVILIDDDDSENYIKGLSFRSGACRKDRERYGVALVAWRDDMGLTGDVLDHEIGHLIGGVHDHVNGTQTNIEHSPFNSDNVNFWFNTTGHRCFGKICPQPPSPQNGDWVCDLDNHSCHLQCDAGFTSPVSTVRCQNGVWEQGTENIGCVESLASGSVYFIAGGGGGHLEYYYDIELYSPTIENVQCSITLPQLDATGTHGWYQHHTFYHNNTIYICDFSKEVCLTYNSQMRGFKTYQIRGGRRGFSPIILRNTLYFIGGSHCNCEPNSTPLPLTDQSVWTAVPNLHYKGDSQCVAKIDEDSFVITGGGNLGGSIFTDVTKYNAKTSVVTSLQRNKHPRYYHTCVVVERDNKKWLIIAGGFNSFSLNSTEMLELEMEGSSWVSLGDLNEKRHGHSMVETERGIMVMGGSRQNNQGTNVVHKSVELLDWVTKLWKVVQPSLNKERREFGGAVKIPASIFNCQVMACPSLNTNTQNRIGWEKLQNIESMEECSSKCRETSSCEVWTWYKEDAGKEALSCILMDSFNTTKMDNSTISAHRNCEIGCPTPPLKQNGTWDCDVGFIKHSKCSLICDPGFSTLRTETKCRDGRWDADIIELECWQQTNSINITGCDGDYLYSQGYIGGDVVTLISPGETCHSVCQSRDDCITWTWTISNTGTEECRIQTSQAQLEESQGAMSGTKNACKPDCYLVLDHHDEAVSTTQYCQQQDDCYDIIRSEPDEFEANDRILVCHEEEEGSYCEDVNYENVNLICNPDPGTVTLTTFQRINKHRFYGHLKPYFGNWGK